MFEEESPGWSWRSTDLCGITASPLLAGFLEVNTGWTGIRSAKGVLYSRISLSWRLARGALQCFRTCEILICGGGGLSRSARGLEGRPPCGTGIGMGMRRAKGERRNTIWDAESGTYQCLLSALLLGRVVPEEALWLGHDAAVRGDHGCSGMGDQITSGRVRKRKATSGKPRAQRARSREEWIVDCGLRMVDLVLRGDAGLDRAAAARTLRRGSGVLQRDIVAMVVISLLHCSAITFLFLLLYDRSYYHNLLPPSGIAEPDCGDSSLATAHQSSLHHSASRYY